MKTDKIKIHEAFKNFVEDKDKHLYEFFKTGEYKDEWKDNIEIKEEESKGQKK